MSQPSAQDFLTAGIELRTAGRLTESIDALRQAVALNPRSATALLELGASAGELGDPEAIEWFQRATVLQPRSALAYWNLAKALLQHAQRKSASQIQAIALQLDPLIASKDLDQLASDKRRVIHCIGDSHCRFFAELKRTLYAPTESGREQHVLFRSYWLGPVLAHNLSEYNTTTRGREQLELALERLIPSGSIVLFALGEIDCRFHLLRQAERQRRPVPDVVADTVERYVSTLESVRSRGFKVLVWNAVPSAPDGTAAPHEFPYFGTQEQRNEVTRMFNEQLAAKCSRDISLVSVIDKLQDDRGQIDYALFKSDRVHLSESVMPLTLAALKPVLSQTDFPDPEDLESAASLGVMRVPNRDWRR